MELELGLALPNNSPNMIKGFDLNSNFHKISNEFESDRNIDEALPLLLWSGQPNDEDDERNPKKNHLKNPYEENDEIVGWSPINSLRKEIHHHHLAGRAIEVRNSPYVKLKMEGVAIGRKIDLRLHNSYHALTNTVIEMFATWDRIDRRTEDYTILYQDREGDWMLAGDVPWKMFIGTVQRMKILRNDKYESCSL